MAWRGVWDLLRRSSLAGPRGGFRSRVRRPVQLDDWDSPTIALVRAASAGLEDLVQAWLADPRCTRELLLRHSVFDMLCREGPPLTGRHDAHLRAWRACASAVAAMLRPDVVRADLDDVVERWLADPACTREVVNRFDSMDGCTAFGASNGGRCMRLLAESGKVLPGDLVFDAVEDDDDDE